MLYGLNNFIKKILPKGLFYRSLLIVAAPIILLQIIITVVFFDSLWIKANKGMTRSLVSEIRTLYDVYSNPDMGQKQTIINLYNKNFDFAISFKQDEMLPKNNAERWYSPMDRSLRRELKSSFQNSFWFDTTSYKTTVKLKIKYKDKEYSGLFKFGGKYINQINLFIGKKKISIDRVFSPPDHIKLPLTILLQTSSELEKPIKSVPP